MSKGKEFKSKVEDLAQVEELVFEATPGFGKYREFMGADSIHHPAKMNTNLLEWLILNLTKKGETILDPFGGTGSTGVVSALHGRNAINVELEPNFYAMMEEARKKVEKHGSLGQKGTIKNILGDSRNLSQMDLTADLVLTSPPYSEGLGHDSGDKASAEHKERLEMQRRYTRQMRSKDNIAELKHGSIDAVITSPPYEASVSDNKEGTGAGANEKKYGRWKKGTAKKQSYTQHDEPCKVDAVITSPPYVPDDQRRIWHISHKEADEKRGYKTMNGYREYYSQDEKNIENPNKYGKIDTVITSPPYSESMTKKRKGYTIFPQLAKTREMPQDTKDENIANLSHGNVDAVITSPPYESSLEGGSKHTKGGIANRDPALAQTGTYAVGGKSSTNNIGNLKKETYLEAMLKVYTEIFKVLKPGGKAIVVVKPFIRDRKAVDLPWHSHLLLSRCGFILEKVYKFRLPTTSFWRVLQYRRCDYAKGTQGDKCSLHGVCSYKATKTCNQCPNYINTLERLNHEYVLVYRKPF
jgi:DNA modification methylase